LIWSLNGAKTALQIESSEMRLLSVDGGRVCRWDSVPLAAGCVRGGRIQDPEAVGRAVAKAFSELNYSRERVVASVSGLMAVSRIIKLPVLKGGELNKAIASETRRLMPVSAGSMRVYTQVVRRGPDGVLIFALGVPSETIDREVKALELAGIFPDSLDLKPLACLRAVRTPTCIMASIETDSLDIVVSVDGLPKLIRSVALAIPPGDHEAAYETMEDELTRIVKFFNDSHRDEALSPSAPIYVAGQLNGDVGSWSSLVLPTGHRAQPYVSPMRCPAGLPLHAYLANVGLALKRN